MHAQYLAHKEPTNASIVEALLHVLRGTRRGLRPLAKASTFVKTAQQKVLSTSAKAGKSLIEFLAVRGWVV